MECIYIFPAKDEEVFVSLTVTTEDGRVLEAKVEDKEVAKEKYFDSISSGDSGIMGRMKGNRFELYIGNLAPNMTVTVAISSLYPLKANYDSWLFKAPEWFQPTCDTEDEIEDTSLFLVPISHPEERYRFGFSLVILESSPILEVTSPTHQVEVVTSEYGMKAEVTLMYKKYPSNNIKIEFKTSEDVSPKVKVQLNELTGEYMGMLSFLPHRLLESEPMPTMVSHRDHVLLFDRSTSMFGRSFQLAKATAIFLIQSLPTGSKFNIVSVGAWFEKIYPESQLTTPSTVTQTISNISKFSANMGDTIKLLDPLEYICSERSDPEYTRSIYLLLGGPIEYDVFSYLKQNSTNTQVNVIMIGDSRSENHRYHFPFQCALILQPKVDIENESQIKKRVHSLLGCLCFSSQNGIRIEWPSNTFMQCQSIQHPHNPFDKINYHFVANFGKSPLEAGKVVMHRLSRTLNLEIDANYQNLISIEKIWAMYAIKQLSVDYRQTKSRDTLQKVISLSKQYEVPCKHTAFICVQTNAKPVDGKLQMTLISQVKEIKIRQGCGKSTLFDSCLRMLVEDSRRLIGSNVPMSVSSITHQQPSAEISMREDLEQAGLQIIQELLLGGISILPRIHARSEWKVAGFLRANGAIRISITAYFSHQGSDASDLWVTLCVVVFIKKQFAAQKKEWEVSVEKSVELLNRAGINIKQESARIKAKFQVQEPIVLIRVVAA